MEQSIEAEHTCQAALEAKKRLDEAHYTWQELLARSYNMEDAGLVKECVLLDLELSGSEVALSTLTDLCQQLSRTQEEHRIATRRLAEKHHQINQFKKLMVGH